MSAQVFIIVCHNKKTDEFEELSVAHTSRKKAETARDNLNKNFTDFNHSIKVLNLQGCIKDSMNHRLYSFSINDNK